VLLQPLLPAMLLQPLLSGVLLLPLPLLLLQPAGLPCCCQQRCPQAPA
jgi:hypothetical protein